MSATLSSITQVQRVRLLYKTILRLHRGLPLEFKAIGDQYVKDEFRRHKSCNPTEGNVFMAEWVVNISLFTNLFQCFNLCFNQGCNELEFAVTITFPDFDFPDSTPVDE